MCYCGIGRSGRVVHFRLRLPLDRIRLSNPNLPTEGPSFPVHRALCGDRVHRCAMFGEYRLHSHIRARFASDDRGIGLDHRFLRQLVLAALVPRTMAVAV